MPCLNPEKTLWAPIYCRAMAAVLLRHRFWKFGLVGFSGVLVNLGVLYLCQEYLLTAIASFTLRLNISLVIAIFLATINNFYWNRRWTWNDRPSRRDKALVVQFGQYLLGTSLGSGLQFVITWGLAFFIYYLAANLCAILLAALGNYLLGDIWVFAPGKTEMRFVDR